MAVGRKGGLEIYRHARTVWEALVVGIILFCLRFTAGKTRDLQLVDNLRKRGVFQPLYLSARHYVTRIRPFYTTNAE